jgi:hypothetical protein
MSARTVFRAGLRITALGLALSLGSPLGPAFAGGPVELAQTKPSLPGGGVSMGQLKRGPDGRLMVVDPTQKVGSSGLGPCSPQSLCVGPGRAYETVASAAMAARPGDVIEIVAGTYRESVALTTPKLTVRGVGGRPHFDCAGLDIAGGKGCFLLAGPDITLENLEISGAEISRKMGGNGACVRNEPDKSFTLRKILCHGSQDGILTTGGSVVIEGSEFYDNGWNGPGHDIWGHNIYLAGNCPKVTVRDSNFHDAREGHEFKSRCSITVIENSTFHAVRGSRAIDVPDGGSVTITGGTIIQEPTVQNNEMIGYAAESCRYPGSVTVRQMHIVGKNPHGVIANYGKCPGGAIRLIGVTYEGFHPTFQGAVVSE